jgi:nucleoside-diphosphate-sugar epimerase
VSPRVLFLGGTGVLSAASAQLAIERGMDVTLLTRGASGRPEPPGARVHHLDVRDPSAVAAAVGGKDYDAVVDFLAFLPGDVRDDLDLFAGHTGQLMLISSASAYQTPPQRQPVTESTPLRNPYWEYSRNKIACEDVAMAAYRERAVPVTIIRPSHTYDASMIPLHGGWTMLERMRAGRPVVVHGDGTSLWTLTHARDFARGLVGLLADPRTAGQAYGITGDDVLTWDQITRALAAAAGVEADIVHVPSDVIAAHDPQWGAGLLGDKAHSMTFDTTKVRDLVPDFATTVRFEQGAREIVAWHENSADRRVVDPELDALIDRLVARFSST